ncbi:glycoside hydrolase family 172 protein [Allokutzneria sp. NRRL B-24872]|uniref:glycoside hydrolase family 172 protein n=1 Tax=Allokutzneria sp. NRRL B-24872 TaxID=1137961 RepID=UPI001FEFFCEE|nr:glycoside hydrolase family 172 protein [Allokutzneria sp. NRRL B-24872]
MRGIRRPDHVRGRALLALITAAATVLATAPAASSQAAAPPAGDKGPVGWAAYRQFDGMAALRGATETRQFSSYDREGRNNDGFTGTYACLRTVATNCVIAERTGAGQVESIWFTRDEGVVTKTGWIKIELDGKTVLKAPLQDVVDGKLGAPFVWPLVGNRDDTSGGVVIKVPMPFRQSMRVTTQNNPMFHHVVYRTFADAEGVPAFDPKDKAADVITRLRSSGLTDPKPERRGASTAKSTVDIQAGASAKVAQLTGPAQISQVRVRLPQVVPSPTVIDDGRAYGKGGGSTFTVAVHPRNTGVRLTRRYDPEVENQLANVLVDGVLAGQWKHKTRLGPLTWAEQSLALAPALTSGKSKITVRNEFVSSDVDFNEFRYDVQSLVDGSWVRTDVMDLGPHRPGEETAHGYKVDKQTWQGRRSSYYPSDAGQVAASDAVLSGTRLRISFDGVTTVDAPIGEFFGSGLGEFDVRSLMFSMDPGKDGWYTAWWPMPFARNAVVELVNGSSTTVQGASVEVTSAPDSTVAERLGAKGSLGYFHAKHRSAAAERDKDWIAVETTGRGVYYGMTHSMRGKLPLGTDVPRLYLEGDERIYSDGVLTPLQYGTGTEDFYESGWYFRTGTFAMPSAGYPAHEVGGDGCQFDCTGAYRLMLADAIPFSSAFRFGIESGPLADVAADYSATSYWYGKSQTTLRNTDRIDLANAKEREQHSYRVESETTAKLNSSFEGDNDHDAATGTVTSTSGKVSFSVAVDQANTGVQLVRTADHARPYQEVKVLVDGKEAGTWLQVTGNASQRWLQDTFVIPAKFTSGKKKLSITLEPAKNSPPWTASDYTVRSYVGPYDAGAARSAAQRLDPAALDWRAPDRGPLVRDSRDPISVRPGR